MTADRRFDSFENCAPVVRSHESQLRELQRRLRYVEKILDTRATPWWKRVVFWLDGWGPWWQIRPWPAWRPWRRWWTS